MKQSYITALDLIKNGDWHSAHDIIEVLESRTAAHIHAYLHRIEGDEWNANYWYRRAGVAPPTCSIEEEWTFIRKMVLDQ